MQCLDRRLQCRPVMLPEYVVGDDDAPVWINAQQVSIVSGVVQYREADAIGDIRLSALIPVRDDVGGLQQFRDWQPRNRAAPVVGGKHQFAEFGLMQTDFRLDRAVAAFDGRRWLSPCGRLHRLILSRDLAHCGGLGQLKLAADRDGTKEVAWIPFHQIAGVENLIDARHQRVEIDQG
jgi:hypothetical protein